MLRRMPQVVIARRLVAEQLFAVLLQTHRQVHARLKLLMRAACTVRESLHVGLHEGCEV